MCSVCILRVSFALVQRALEWLIVAPIHHEPRRRGMGLRDLRKLREAAVSQRALRAAA